MGRHSRANPPQSQSCLSRRNILGALSGGILTGLLATQTGIGSASDDDPPTQQWTVSTDGRVRSSPVVTDNTIIFGTDGGTVYATSPSGEKEWESDVADRIVGSPCVNSDTVYVAGMIQREDATEETVYSGTLHALNLADGTKRWDIVVNPPIGGPTYHNGAVHIGFADDSGGVTTVDTHDGAPFRSDWGLYLDDSINAASTGSPVTDGDYLYVTTYAGDVWKVRTTRDTDGDRVIEEWKTSLGSPIRGSPTVTDDSVYTVTTSGTVYSLSKLNGGVEWSRDLDTYTRTTPTVHEDTLYVTAHDDFKFLGDDDYVYNSSGANVYALDATTGSRQWSHATDFNTISSPTVAGNRVFVHGTKDGDDGDGADDWDVLDVVQTLDSDSGDVVWETSRGSPVERGPFVGTVPMFDPENVVTDESDFERQPGAVASTPTVVGGTLFVGESSRDASTLVAYDIGLATNSAGSRTQTKALGYHTYPPVEGVDTISADDIEISIENRFETQSTESFLEGLYTDVGQAIPFVQALPGRDDPLLVDESEAYIDLNLRLSAPFYAPVIESISPYFTHEKADEEVGLRDIRDIFTEDDLEDPPELTELEPGMWGLEPFRVRTKTQLGIQWWESLMVFAPGHAPPIEADPYDFPDVYVTGLEVEFSDGRTERVDVERRLPRFDDACTTVTLSQQVNEDCSERSSWGNQSGGAVVMSPATVAVQGREGDYTGRISAAEPVRDDALDDVFYSGPLRHEFVVFPQDNLLDLVIDGTDEGTVTIVIDYALDNHMEFETRTYKDIEVDSDTRIKTTASKEYTTLEIIDNYEIEILDEVEPDHIERYDHDEFLEARAQTGGKPPGVVDSEPSDEYETIYEVASAEGDQGLGGSDNAVSDPEDEDEAAESDGDSGIPTWVPIAGAGGLLGGALLKRYIDRDKSDRTG